MIFLCYYYICDYQISLLITIYDNYLLLYHKNKRKDKKSMNIINFITSNYIYITVIALAIYILFIVLGDLHKRKLLKKKENENQETKII